MTRFSVVSPVSPDMPFAKLKVGQLFKTKYSAEVWMKISAAYFLQIDNPDVKHRQNDEREIVTRVILEREDV